MRREHLIEAIEQVNEAINQSNIYPLLRDYSIIISQGKSETRERTKETPEVSLLDLVDSFKKYTILAQNFSPAAKKVAGILGLDQLEQSSTWMMLMRPHPRREKTIAKLNDALRIANLALPKLVPLIRQDAYSLISESGESIVSAYKDRSTLSVTIIEENHRFSSPARLIRVLDSISKLYEACAMLVEQSPEGLSVIACDSGSDKSFDFLGLAKVMECVKEVILSLWDRIVFFKEHKLSEQIELIEKSLPIIEQIAKLEEEKRIVPEQAELLRRQIISGINDFTKAGATIPEMSERTNYDPRLLMAPEPKLLTSAPPDEPHENETYVEEESDLLIDEEKTEEQDVSSRSTDNLTEEERVQLRELLRKLNKKEIEDSENDGEEDTQ